MPDVEEEDSDLISDSLAEEDAKKIIRETVAEVEASSKSSEKEEPEKKTAPKKSGDLFSEERFSDKTAQQAFESRFSDIQPKADKKPEE